MSRTARIERATSESSVVVEINLDGTGQTDISTTVPFYDHMLTALGRHSLIDITVRATGDTEIDVHHTVEDTAICIGEALRVALGDKRGIRRFGQACVPLDEALAEAVVDISGRPYLVHTGESEAFVHHLIGGHFTGSMVRHVLEAIAYHAGICLHVRVLSGRDPHHIAEAEFKALARALRAADGQGIEALLQPASAMGPTALIRQLLPRLIVVAEVGWHGERALPWDRLRPIIERESAHLGRAIPRRSAARIVEGRAPQAGTRPVPPSGARFGAGMEPTPLGSL